MKRQYLEVTFRRGKPFAAYLYLPHPAGAKSVLTEDAGSGMRIDFGADGTPLGVEITAPVLIGVADVNRVLTQLGVPTIEQEDWAPLRAA